MANILAWDTPINAPVFRELNLDIQASRFYFELEKALRFFQEKIANTYMSHEYKRALSSWLETINNTDFDQEGEILVEQSLTEKFWIVAKPLFVSQEFIEVFCPACSNTLDKEDTYIEEWSHGEGWRAMGGKCVKCNHGHVLYAHTTWEA